MLIDIDNKLIEQIQHHEDVKQFVEKALRNFLEKEQHKSDVKKHLKESLLKNAELCKLLAQ